MELALGSTSAAAAMGILGGSRGSRSSTRCTPIGRCSLAFSSLFSLSRCRGCSPGRWDNLIKFRICRISPVFLPLTQRTRR